MREIGEKNIGEKLQILLEEKHPLEEDIGILNEKGELLGVVITKEAYNFFLKKVEEEEDRIDHETIEAFHKSGEKYDK